ncbi:type I toxin-antitoxin system SymE family toxin [Exilibacterium tricleocarpae]|uniref:Type I toxin-antitoxin system SymE family toxin n=1 Tax=Exilibacterium tricleocarpae TaxID=2591008 RepID=A0A545U488_9GAMM|nr:type I toxin-antitoxin system SymE family toxin [Exilibacterium tricleocarpae]TQV84278.1 type I toxin-antitoxin system SymE family toxin [Exilibacterium tricleocarpae]
MVFNYLIFEAPAQNTIPLYGLSARAMDTDEREVVGESGFGIDTPVKVEVSEGRLVLIVE